MANCKCVYATGGKRDIPDDRDYIRKYGTHMIPKKERDPKVDLRKFIDQVYDQGKLECCTSNALCSAFTLDLMRQAAKKNVKYIPYDPSRLFVFYNSRACDDTCSENAGVSLRFALKAMNYVGVCQEFQWPYDEAKVSQQPPYSCYKAAAENTICKYERLDQDINQFRACLKEGFPIAFGLKIYDSFIDVGKKGIIPMPTKDEVDNYKPLLHALLAVGYDDKNDRIIALNSWGNSFGDKGYVYIPYKYIIDPDRTFDFWKIESVCERDDKEEQEPET